MDVYIIHNDNTYMKSLSNNFKPKKLNNFKLNDNVEFLEKTTRNWRYGKIIEINSKFDSYKIYSGIDVFWAKQTTTGDKVQLETI